MSTTTNIQLPDPDVLAAAPLEVQREWHRHLAALQLSRQYDLRQSANNIQVAFWKSQARIRGWFTANRVGKTTGGVFEVDCHCRGEHPYKKVTEPPVIWRVVGDGYNQGINQIILPKFKQHVNPIYLRGGSWDAAYNKGERTLYYENKSRVQFMSYNLDDGGRGAQSFAGVELDGFWFDEHGPHRVFDECMARVGRRPLYVFVTLTPVLGITWEHDEIYQQWQDGVAGYECFQGTIWDNIKNLDRETVEAYLSSIQDPRMREIRETGAWLHLAGAVYSMWDDDVHVIPFDAARVRNATKTVIIDTHPSKPEAILWCGVDQHGMFAYREALINKTVAEVCDDIRRYSQEHGEDIRRFLIDPHWGWNEKETKKSKAQLYIDNGIPVVPAYRARLDSDLFIPMQQLLSVSPTTGKSRFAVMASCPKLIWQFKHNKFKPQSDAMAEGDAWVRTKEDDDLLADAEYFIKSNPLYLGQARPVLEPTFAGVARRSATSR